jgi:hypothetical protein
MKGLSIPEERFASGTLKPFIRNAETFHQERSILSSGTFKPFIRNAQNQKIGKSNNLLFSP